MKLASCPICHKSLHTDSPKPFCSTRCKEVDLHRWLSEGYIVPDTADSDDDSEETSQILDEDAYDTES